MKKCSSTKCIVTMLLCVFLLNISGYSQNYPFPQNYKYPYGSVYTGTDVQSKIQGLYNTWKTTYYQEGTISGTPCARIKFLQSGQDGTNTVSEGIGYGMLIFVYMDNTLNSTQDEFNKLWAYYQKNQNANGLMNSKVSAFTAQVVNNYSNTSADIDVATALLLAHKQWGSSGTINYKDAARVLINSIYTNEVDGNKLLKPSDSYNDYANPSDYIMNSIQLFGNVEISESWQTANRWDAVKTACYNLIKTARNATSGLVPDWCATPNGTSISGIIDDTYESYFLYDAIQVPWRMAQAYAWYGDADAKDVASKITTWAQTNYNDPASIWDGYLLNGVKYNNPTGNANFTSIGTTHNPCFSGGLSIGSMVDATFNSYMGKCWTVGSLNDPYGSYFTQTTQLLYMLTLSGNMPNLWNIKPVPTAAETNGTGNVIYIDFSKAINSSTTSTAGWTVSTYANGSDATATTVAVSSVAVDGTNPKRLIVSLNSDIIEPIISISYNGTLLEGTDASKVLNFNQLHVLNKLVNVEPYVIYRTINIIGTEIYIKWSKPITATSVSVSAFAVKVNGTATTILTAALDATDPSILILTIPGGVITSNTATVTVSYVGGTIASTTSTKTALAFTDSPVQNYYLNTTCYNIENFDSPIITFATSGTGCTWSGTTADPASAQTGNVGKLVVTTNQTYHNVTGTLTAAQITSFNTALAGGSRILKFRMYVTNQHATDKTIRIRIFKYDAADPYGWKDHMFYDFPVSTIGAWVNYEYDLTGQYNSALQYDRITIEPSPEDASAETVYIDDIRVCPAPPTVNFVNAKLNYDGSEIEMKFNTAMKVPTVANSITIYADAVATTVTSVTAKQGDASVLVLKLSTPIASSTAVVTATYNGVSGTVYAFDGRVAENFYDQPVANLYGISVTTGWRDDFVSTTDFVTANIGLGTNFTAVESATAPGTYKMTGTGTVKWDPMSVTVYGTGATDLKQVMDLTGREIVQIRYRVPAATSTTLYLRIDVKDKVRGCTSDAMTFIPLTFTAGSTTWIDKTINLNFLSIYGTPSGNVDRTNIQQVSFHFIEKEGTSANNYIPTNFKGQIEFDYISIGSALTLTGVPASVNEGSPVAGTSSATGKIFLVPANTPPMLRALQDSVFAGRGAVIDVTAGVAGSIPTTGLAAGYYEAYAYDPTAGALSAKVGVNINDITAPIITQFSSGNFAATGTISGTVNEDATLYLIPASVTNYAIANIIDNMVYSIQVAKNVSTSILLSDVPGVLVGNTYKFIAADYAYPNPNVSSTATSPNIIINQISVPVSSIAITPSSLILTTASSTQLVATILPVNAANTSITWSTSNNSVVVVSSAGIVTALGVGTAIITATANDGSGVAATCVVSVSPIQIPTFSITVNPTQANLHVSEELAIQTVIIPETTTDVTINWTSSNPTVAVVDNQGVVTAIGIGTAIITAIVPELGNISDEVVIHVTPKLVSEILIVPSSIILDPQDIESLVTVISPSDATNKAIVWSSSNINVALVNSQGIVTAIAEGTTEIRATSTDGSSVYGVCSVTVNAPVVVPCTDLQVFANITNVDCYGEETGSIGLVVNGGTSPYSYKWSNTGTGSSLENAGAGTYSVIITDSEGCSTVKNYSITESTSVEVSSTVVEPACGISNGSISLQVTGGTLPYTYQWNTLSSTSSVSSLGAGLYTVIVGDSKGCETEKTIQLNNAGAPQITLESVVESACNASTGSIYVSVSGGSTPYVYEWNDAIHTEDRINIAPGEYTIRVTDNEGCIGVLDTEVPSTTLLQPSISLVTVDRETGKNLIVWQKEETDLIDYYTIYRENTVAGQYDVLGTSPYSATSIYEDPDANSNIRSWRYKISATDVCGNETALSEEHKTIHLQKNLGMNQEINLDWDGYEGIYFSTYTIYSLNTVEELMPIAELPSSITRYTVSPIPSNVTSYYVGINLPESIDEDETLLKMQTGPFTLAMSNIAEVETGITSVVENGIKIYPSITSDFVHVDYNSTKLAKVYLISASGEVVYTSMINKNVQIPVCQLAKGMYTLQVESGNEVVQKQIIVQ